MANISLVILSTDSNGNLIVRKRTGIAYESFGGTYEQEYEDIDKLDMNDDSKFGELLEYETCNGWGYTTRISYYGHLSEAPAIWQSDDEDEDCSPVRGFWYDDWYCHSSAWERFKLNGKVIFYRFNCIPQNDIKSYKK